MLHPCKGLKRYRHTGKSLRSLLRRSHPSYFLRGVYLLLSRKIHSNSVCKAAYKSEVDFEIKFFINLKTPEAIKEKGLP